MINSNPKTFFGSQEGVNFTVLMPIYDRDDITKLFSRAISSVFANTVLPIEFILVVDGPVGKVLKKLIIEFELVYGLNVIWLPENVGIASALNIGLKHVKTEWVIRADADDYNLPNRFEELVKLVNSNVDIIGSAIEEVDMNGRRIATKSPPLDHQEILKFAKYRNPFNHMAVAFRVSRAIDCGGYPEIYLKEDYALWVLMMKNGAYAMNTSQVLVHATTGADMYKRRGGLRYAKAEIDLQKHLIQCGVKGYFSGFLHGFVRSVIFLIPQSMRGWIYESFLRDNKTGTTHNLVN